MMYYIFGGIASGKSAFGETLATSLSEAPLYVATMKNIGKSAKKKIKKHRESRIGKGFFTIECEKDIASIDVTHADVILLEDISNLLANHMFTAQGLIKNHEILPTQLIFFLQELSKRCKDLIIIGNDIFADTGIYSLETHLYIDYLKEIHTYLCMHADYVYECIYQQIRKLK